MYNSLVIFVLLAFSANAQISGKSILEIKQELQSSETILQPTSSIINPSTFPLEADKSAFKPFHLSTKSYPPPPRADRHPPILLSFYFLQTDIPNLHTYEHLPFFCKVEVKLEQAAKFPIKFRLGDVQYVDYLEGKRDTKYW